MYNFRNEIFKTFLRRIKFYFLVELIFLLKACKNYKYSLNFEMYITYCIDLNILYLIIYRNNDNT